MKDGCEVTQLDDGDDFKRKSKGPESQLILVMDNFHCACYCWSSEPKGKEKNDFDDIVMGHWYFL